MHKGFKRSQVFNLLGINMEIPEWLLSALEKGRVEQREFGGVEYLRLKYPYKGRERGTIVVGSREYPGFPHIPRVFSLEKGILRNIPTDAFYLEEKIDGSNVRAMFFGGRVFGISRGGIIDAFSSEKLEFIIPKKARHGHLMLCGELIGNTPYTRPESRYDVKFLVFGIYDFDKGEYLPPQEKYAKIRELGLEGVPRLGRLTKDNIERAESVALMLNMKRKEGMVIRAESGNDVIKYVNPSADIDDMLNSSKQMLDMPSGFFNQRVLRSAVFLHEHKLPRARYARMLGDALFRSISQGISMIGTDNQVWDEFEIRVKNPEFVWKELMSHMGKEVRVEKIYQKRMPNGLYRIRFRKIYVRMSRELREFLSGKKICD
jgi:putative ATP-dependent DNA ligase